MKKIFESFQDFIYEATMVAQYLEPIVVKRGLSKDWLKAFEKYSKIVPKEALPTVFCNFSSYNKVTGRKLNDGGRDTSNKYGVAVASSSVEVPKELVPQEFIDAKVEAGWLKLHSLEITKTINLHDFELKKSIVVSAVNSKNFKSNSDISTRKESVNQQYATKTGNLWSLNQTLEGVVVHEMGHVFDNRCYVSRQSDWVSIVSKWKQGLTQKIDILDKPSEAWAEAFSNYFVDNGKGLPDFVYAYIKKEINRKRFNF